MSANYRLTPNSINEIRYHASNMLDNTMALRLIDFPLTMSDIDRGMWSDADFAAYSRLIADDRLVLHKVAAISLMMPNPAVEGMSVTVQVHATRNGYSNSIFPQLRGSTPFYPTRLTEEKREALEKWLAPATLWARKVKAAKEIIREFMDHCGPTLGSMHARWPEFGMVLLSMNSPWPERMRAVPRRVLDKYRWQSSSVDYDWYIDNHAKIRGVGVMLTGALQLGQVSETTDLHASIKSWTLPEKPE